VTIGTILGYAAITEGKSSVLWKLAYLIHFPVIIPMQSFLVAIDKADAFPLIIVAVVIYWVTIGLAVAGVILKLQRKKPKFD
jgi:hypothetical protein